MTSNVLFRLDWFSLLIYLLLIIFGITNIYSTTLSEDTVSLFELASPAGKQFWIFIFCFFFLPITLYINSNFFEHLSLVFYILSILSLLGLFVFGQKISGATSWYLIGGFSLQPSELAKITTSLLLASSLSSIQMDINKRAFLFKIFFIIGLPFFLILVQPDAGSGWPRPGRPGKAAGGSSSRPQDTHYLHAACRLLLCCSVFHGHPMVHIWLYMLCSLVHLD